MYNNIQTSLESLLKPISFDFVIIEYTHYQKKQNSLISIHIQTIKEQTLKNIIQNF